MIVGYERSVEEAIRRSVLRTQDNTVVSVQRFFNQVQNGNAFSVSKRFESVASDAYIQLFFENPSGSGKIVHIVMIEVVSLAQLWVDIYRGNTKSSSGTVLTPVNLNFASTKSSVVGVEYGGTYSFGTLVHNTVCPGGSHIRAVGGAAEVGENVVMPEDFNFIVVVRNKSANNTDFSIRILWWEESV